MKTNELQLGDYVKCSDKGIPMVVVGIYGDVAYLDFEGNESDMWEVDEEDLVPIPITKEILEKNGFKYRESNKDYFILVGWRTIQYDIKTHLFCVTGYSIESGRAEYVHELQQPMRKCNIDKEIEL